MLDFEFRMVYRVAPRHCASAVNLASRNDVSYVSLNRDVRPMGHVSRTTGADLVRGSDSGGSNNALDGTGIGIAVLDSGIDVDHHSFLNRSNGVRVGRSGAHRLSVARSARRHRRRHPRPGREDVGRSLSSPHRDEWRVPICGQRMVNNGACRRTVRDLGQPRCL